MEEQIREIEKLLKNFWCDVYQSDRYPSCVVCVRIEGDWKHDHIAARNILAENGYNEVSEVLVDEDGSDCYTSVHLVMKKPKEFVDALKKLFA